MAQLLLNGTVVDSRSISFVSDWTINAAAGADSLLVNYGFTGGFFSFSVNFNGEDPALAALSDDMLAIAGGVFTTVTHDFTTPALAATQKGTLTYTTAASGTGVITYTGVASVNMAADTDTDPTTSSEPGRSTIADLVFKLPGARDLALLSDDGVAGTDVSQLHSQASTPTFAATLLATPSNSLTVYMGDDDGALTVGSAADLTMALVINGQAGANDTVTFQGTVNPSALTVTVSGAIADQPGTTLNVAGLAQFDAGASAITLGDNPADIVKLGSLTVSGGAVAITTDSAIVLTGVNTADSLALEADGGSITDAAGTSLSVTNDATLTGDAITLGDDVGDTTNFGTLTFSATGAVSISEDSSTDLNGTNAADSLDLASTGAIRDLAGTSLTVANHAVVTGTAITLGDNSADTTNFGTLTFSATGAVAISEDSSTDFEGVNSADSLDLVSAGAIGDLTGTSLTVANLATLSGTAITLGDDLADTTNFGTLTFNASGAVSISEDSSTNLEGSNTADSLTLISAGAISDLTGTGLKVTNHASFRGTAITLGDDVADTTNLGTLTFSATGAVAITEDSSTVVEGTNSADSLALVSAGAISDLAGTSLMVTNHATLTGTAITLGDDVADTTNFGTLTFSASGAVSIAEDSNTDLAGTNTADSLVLMSTGAISDLTGTSLTVTNHASFTGAAITLGDDVADTTNFGTLTFSASGAVSISEDSSTNLEGTNSADSLLLVSAGAISDLAGTSLTVTNHATMTGTAITLGDNVADTTNFGTLTFNAGGAVAISEDSSTDLEGTNTADSLVLISAGAIRDLAGISLSVTNHATLTGTAITLGDDVADTTNFGTVTFNAGGAVSISEDSSTVLEGTNTADSLGLSSAGAISDLAGTSLTVTSHATFTGTAITLGDNVADTTNFGTLTFSAGGAVSISEDSSTVLEGTNTADSLGLSSAGAISDLSGTSLTVTNHAIFTATAITLGDDVADTTNFGTLTFHATGAVAISEDSSTVLEGTNTADSLVLVSASAISDLPGISLTVTNHASFTGTGITLGDNVADTTNFGTLTFNGTAAVAISEDSSTALEGTNAADSLVLVSAGAITDLAGTSLSVTNHAILTGTAITLGDNVADTTNFGTLTFNAGGAVSISEDSSTALEGTNTADSLVLVSAGAISDLAGTSLTVTNHAAFTGTAITLGDDVADTANFGTLTFNATGAVSIAEDSSTALEGTNTADSLAVVSTGAITDLAGTNLTVTNHAALTGTAITLGDNAADTTNFGSVTFSASGNVLLSEDSSMQLTGANTGASVDLDAQGVTEASGATITATSLHLTGTGPFTLAGNNDVDTLTAAITGALQYFDIDDLTIASGGITSSGDVTVVTQTLDLTLAGGIAAGTGIVRLQAGGATKQTAGSVTGSALGLRAGGDIRLPSAGNNVATLAGATGGSFTYADADAFTFGTVSVQGPFTPAVSGLTVNGDITLCQVSGTMNINIPLNAGGNTIRLQAGAGVTASDVLTANNLGVRAGGAIDLDNATNSVTGVVAFNAIAAGAVTFLNAGGFTVGAVAASLPCFTGATNVSTANGAISMQGGGTIVTSSVVSSTDSDANDITIIATAGDIVITTVNAGAAQGDVTLTATAGSLLADAVLGAHVTGDVLTLSAQRAIGQPGAGKEIDTNVHSVSATTTGAGPFAGTPVPGIWLSETDDLTVTNAVTGDGAIIIDAGGALDAQDVVAGGSGRNIRLRAQGGDLHAGFVSAAGDDILLVTSGAVTDGDAGNDVVANRLEIQTGAGIATLADPLETTVGTLAASGGAGGAFVSNTGFLTLDSLTLFGVSVTGISGAGAARITTTRGLMIAADVLMTGDITLIAGETNDPPDHSESLTLQSGVTVESSAGNIALYAGDDVILQDNVTVQAALAIEFLAGFNDLDNYGALIVDPTATIIAGTDLGIGVVGDLSVSNLTANGAVSLRSLRGSILDGNGSALNIQAAALAMEAATGIGVSGAVVDALETQVGKVEATTVSGGVFLGNDGDLAVGGVVPASFIDPLTGVRVTGVAGAIEIDVTGTLTVLVSGDAVSAPGDITVTATLAIVTGGNQVAVGSSGGAVNLDAGRNLILGDTLLQFPGDVQGATGISLTAGSQILVDEGTHVDAGAAAKIVADAGSDLFLQQTHVAGARITTQRGGILLMVGGRVVAAGGGIGISATQQGAAGADITVCADTIRLNDPVDAGDGTARLTAADFIWANASITAQALGVYSTIGNIDLDNVANHIASTFAAQTLAVGGNIDFRNSGGFATGQVTAADCFATTVTGVSTSAGRVELVADAGTIILGTTAIAGSGIDNGGGLVLLEATTGAVTQTAEGAIAGGTLAVRAGGNVTLAAAGNDVDTLAVNVTSGAGLIEFHDTDALTVGSVTVALAGLQFIGTISALASGGGDINLRTGGALTFSYGANAGAGDIRLRVGAGITQDATHGALVADELGILAQGDVTLCASTTNDVNTLAVSTSGLVEFRDSDDLHIGAVSAGGAAGFTGATGISFNGNPTAHDVNLRTGTSLALDEAVLAGTGDVRIVAGSSISQLGIGYVHADELGVLAGGQVSLGAAASNDVNTLAVNAAGVVEFRDADDLIVGTVAAGGNCGFSGASGIDSASHDINIRTSALLDIENAVTAGGSTLRLWATGGAPVGIVQAAAGTLTAAALSVSAAAFIDLDNTANAISATLAASSSGGSVHFRNAGNFTVGQVAGAGVVPGTVTGVSAGGAFGFAILVNDVGTLTIGTATSGTGISASAGVGLNSGGAVDQTAQGVIVAPFAMIQGGGDVTLAAALNDVDRLAVATSGLIEFRDSDDLAIDEATVVSTSFTASLAGLDSGGGDINLRTGGALSINQSIGAGGGDLRVLAGGGVTQAALGTIQADDAGIRGAGAVTLTAGNNVNVLAATTSSGVLEFRDVDTLTIGSVTTGGGAGFTTTNGLTTVNTDIVVCVDVGNLTVSQAVDAGAAAVRLQAAGNISAAAALTASALGVYTSGGNIDLDNAANQIASTFAAQTLAAGGNIDFRNAGGFATGQVTALDCFSNTVTGATTSAGRVELVADAGTITLGAANLAGSGIQDSGGLVLIEATAGPVTQAAEGAVVAGTLAVRAQGNVTLAAAGNDVDTLAVYVTGGAGLIEFRDSDALTIGSVTVAISGLRFTGTVAGLVSGGGDINVRTGGSLTLTNGVNAGTGDVRLVVGGGITQTGTILADELGIRASGAITLLAGNDVNTLAATTTSGALAFEDINSLTIASVATGGGAGFTTVTGVSTSDANITLCAEGGALTLNQAVNAGAATVRLHALGTISQTSTGFIGGNALGVLSAGASIDLDAAINNIASTFAAQALAAGATVDFRNAQGFNLGQVSAADCFPATVTGIQVTSGDITLCADGGTLGINQPLTTSGTVRLQANGNITQTAAGLITAQALGLRSLFGFIDLDATSNLISSTLAASAGQFGGRIEFRNANGFVTGQVTATGCFATAVVGVNANVGPVTLCADTGNIVVGQAGVPGSGISSGNVNRLQATAGNVTQVAEGAVQGSRLGVRAGGAVTLTAAANHNDFLAIAANGLVEYRDTGNVVIQNVTASGCFTPDVVGVSSDNHDINLNIAGNLTLNDATAGLASLDAGSGDIRIVAGGFVSQTGVDDFVRGDELGIRAGTSVTLSLAPSNDVNVLAVAATLGLVDFIDADDLVIGTVAAGGSAGFTTAVSGIISGGGNVGIRSSANLTIIQPINAGAATVRLQASTGAVSQAASGTLAASALGVQAAGDIALDKTVNAISATFAARSSGGNVLFHNANGFSVGQVTGAGAVPTSVTGVSGNNVILSNDAGTFTIGAGVPGTGISAGDQVALRSGGAVTQTAQGAIVASRLLLQAASDVTLTAAANNVAAMALTTTGLVELRDNSALTISAISVASTAFTATIAGLTSSGGNVNLQVQGTLGIASNGSGAGFINAGAGDIRLRVSGSVSQAAAANTVIGHQFGIVAGGGVSLGLAPNDVDIIAINAAGGITFRDRDDLTVGSVTAGGNAGFTGATGIINTAAGDITLSTDDAPSAGQNLTVLGTVTIQAVAGNIVLSAGDNFTLQAGAIIHASSNVTIHGDAGNADPGVGATIILDGTITNGGLATVLGDSDDDTIALRRKGTGAITIDGAGGSDDVTVQLGNLAGIVTVSDSGAAGTDRLHILGTASADTLTLTASALTSPSEVVNYAGVEALEVFGFDGADAFNVRGTNAATATLLDGGADDDAFVVSSDAPTIAGNLNGIVGALTVEAGAGDFNRLTVNDSAGAGHPNILLSNNQIQGLAPALITYGASGGHFQAADGDGIVLRGSDIDPDTFTIRGTLAGSTTRLEGLGGADTFANEGAFTTGGDLDVIAGPLTILAGAPGPFASIDCDADPVGTRDVLYLNDQADGGAQNYLVDGTRVISTTPRAFAGVTFDDTMDYVRLDGTDLRNIFDVSPSLTTQFYIDGNLPAPLSGRPLAGDFLRLHSEATTGRHLHIEGPGKGYWSFTSGHQNVCFESIERFNHVAILAVANASGSPYVKVYDAETYEFKFQVLAYESFFKGGVRVATGDIDGDGLPDLIVAPGAGRASTIKVYNGAPNSTGQYAHQIMTSFNAFPAQFKGGVYVAVGDVNGDGANEIIAAPDAGWLPQVLIFNGPTVKTTHTLLAPSFLAFGNTFRGGVRVAAGDLNGDGRAEIIAASGPGMSATVHVYSGATLRQINSFLPFGATFKNGLFVAAGDFNGDGVRDVIASADRGWLPYVSVLDGASVYGGHAVTQIARFLAFSNQNRTGVRVAAAPLEGSSVGGVDQVKLLLSSGPKGGADSRKVRQATFNGLSANVVDRVFENSKANNAYIFDGIFVG